MLTDRVLRSSVGCLVVAVSLLLVAGSASAKKVFSYVDANTYIDGSGSEKGPFHQLGPAGYDEANQRFLVVSRQGSSAYLTKFTTSGTPSPFSGPGLGDSLALPEVLSQEAANISLDNTGGPFDGSIYLIRGSANDNPTVRAFRVDGTAVPAFSSITGLNREAIAVDPQGDIRIGEINGGTAIHRWLPDGTDTGYGNEVFLDHNGSFVFARLAIDTEGNLYILRHADDKVYKFSPAGELLYKLSPTNVSKGFAIDSSNDDVFVLEVGASGEFVSQYDRFGTKVNSFGLGPPGSAGNQLAVNDASGTLFAADPGAGRAQRLDPPGYLTAGHLDTPERRGLATGVAVNQTSGDSYMASAAQLESKYEQSGFLQRFDSAGTELACPNTLEHPAGLAIDPTDGDLYVVDINPAGGAQLRTLPAACGAQTGSFAVDYQAGAGLPQPATDSSGNVYYPNAVEHRLEEFDPAGVLKRAFGWDVVSAGPDDTAGNEYEVCVTANGDNCKAGVPGGGGLGQFSNPISVALGTTDEIYVADGRLQKVNADGSSPTVVSSEAKSVAVDKSSGEVFVGRGSGPTFRIQRYSGAGAPLGGELDEGLFGGYQGLQNASSLAVDPATHDVWISNNVSYASGIRHLEKFVRGPANTTVPTTTSTSVDYEGIAATLNGVINPDGVATVDCHFEWGPTRTLGQSVPCDQGNVFTGSSDSDVTAPISGLTKGTTYFYRLSGYNSNGIPSPATTLEFIAQEPPDPSHAFTDAINVDGVVLHAEIDPEGGPTKYRFEYGTDESYGSSTPVDSLEDLLGEQAVSKQLLGLQPDTTYHYRVVAENDAGSVPGPDRTFTTFAADPGTDPCPNAQVRKQTGSALLLDCRAYELVSAANAGGYDVESDLAPGQLPLVSPAKAGDRLLYSLHQGAVPGIAGNPTNFGRDPYVASRTSTGWTTEYVGLPADGMAEQGPFGSPLLETSSSLARFLFGGDGICDPCFAPSSINIPLREPDGSIVAAMAGLLEPVTINPSGQVAKYLSADEGHLVFGTKSKLEPAGKNGFTTIYERELSEEGKELSEEEEEEDKTQVVSTLPSGATIGAGAGWELDLSSDGSRVLIGQKLGADAKGNNRYHLYLHLGTDPHSVDLSPGTTSGVYFDGMSEDGSQVYYTTAEKLLPADTDESADVYRTEVDSGAAVQRSLVSVATAGPSNDDACTPTGAPDTWNAPAGNGKCGALAFAGGGGVVPQTGALYFLSPELLDGPGNGVAGLPNLYLEAPGGVPRFLAAIGVGPATAHAIDAAATRRLSDFQATPDGHFVAFGSDRSLTGFDSRGFEEIFRYDSQADLLICVSCPSSLAAPASDTSLPEYGSGLTDDGRVFFDSAEPYVLRDANGETDVYERSGSALQLITTGEAPEGSSLLTVSSDGVNAYFFTREVLASGDENGSAVKVYDAREGGGFLFRAPPFPCAASDECHGAGTSQPPPPQINTREGSGRNSGVESKRCRRGFLRRHGRCVRRHHKKHRRHLNHRRSGR
jgi:hypothetical protein